MVFSEDARFMQASLNMYKFLVDAGICNNLRSIGKKYSINYDYVRLENIVKNINSIRSTLGHNLDERNGTEEDKEAVEQWFLKVVGKKQLTNAEEYKKVVEEIEKYGEESVAILTDFIEAVGKSGKKNEIIEEWENLIINFYKRSNSKKIFEISLGERNIIALCYYFANIMQNQEFEESHAQEYILLIDDPVSSFDIENKVGIMSFLKYQLGLFLLGNINTKAIVMTHDLLTFYDLDKIYEELIENCNEKFSGNKMKFNRLEMAKQNIKQFEYKNRQEYTELIKIIYKYALGEAEEYEIIIGNIIRQVLEAFSTFQYKKNIEKISTDSFILNDIPKQYRAYFNNLMYRLVLHGGSHREEQVKALDDLNFFSVISSEEKIRTAKDVLCYLYILNAKHVLSHLKDSGNNVKSNLERWCSDIENMSVA